MAEEHASDSAAVIRLRRLSMEDIARDQTGKSTTAIRMTALVRLSTSLRDGQAELTQLSE